MSPGYLPSLLTQQDAGSLSSSPVALLQCARVAGKIRVCSRARFISLSRSSSMYLHHRGHDIKWLFYRIGGSEPDLFVVQVFFDRFPIHARWCYSLLDLLMRCYS